MANSGRRKLIENYPDMVDEFIKAVTLGMSNKMACAYAGISEDVFYVWQRKAEEAEQEGKEDDAYVKFLKRYKNAKAKFQARHLARITQASDDGTWQASAWLLERRCPEEFGQKTDVNVADSKVVVVSNVKREDGAD